MTYHKKPTPLALAQIRIKYGMYLMSKKPKPLLDEFAPEVIEKAGSLLTKEGMEEAKILDENKG